MAMTKEMAVKGLKRLRSVFSGYKPNEEMFDMAIEALIHEPKRGRWIDTGEIWADMYTADEDPIYKCSACNEEVIGGSIHFAYCPNCGARMENK